MVDSNAERAQLLLITALLIATFIMSAVVLLNLLHESPTFDTQQDSISMSDTERVSAQLEGDLHQYFYAHTSDELVGYAADDFDDEINRSGSRYTNLIGQSASGHLNVEYNSGESETGAIVYGNETTETSEQIFTEIEGITRFYLEGMGEENTQLEFDIDNESDVFTVSDNEVSWNDESIEWDEFVEIDITYGGGEVRTDEGYLDGIELNTSDEFNVSANIENLEEGRFYMTTEDEQPATEAEDEFYTAGFGVEPVIVNPAFDITYTNPDIRYSSTIQLFEERDQ